MTHKVRFEPYEGIKGTDKDFIPFYFPFNEFPQEQHVIYKFNGFLYHVLNIMVDLQALPEEAITIILY